MSQNRSLEQTSYPGPWDFLAENCGFGSELEQFRIDNKPDVQPSVSISSPFTGRFLASRNVPIQKYKRLYYLGTNVTSDFYLSIFYYLKFIPRL